MPTPCTLQHAVVCAVTTDAPTIASNEEYDTHACCGRWWHPYPLQQLDHRLRLTVDMPVKNTYERITALDHTQHRVAWKMDGGLPGLMAERWQALSVVNNSDASGKVQVLYENREEFHGVSAYGVKIFVGAAVVRGFERTAAALKARTEALTQS